LHKSFRINVHFWLHLGKHKLGVTSQLAGKILQRPKSLCNNTSLVGGLGPGILATNCLHSLGVLLKSEIFAESLAREMRNLKSKTFSEKNH